MKSTDVSPCGQPVVAFAAAGALAALGRGPSGFALALLSGARLSSLIFARPRRARGRVSKI